MKHTISRTILAISLALCAAHLGLAQNKSTGDHATATYQSQNNKPGTSDSVQAVNAAGSGSKTPARSFATQKRRKRIFLH